MIKINSSKKKQLFPLVASCLSEWLCITYGVRKHGAFHVPCWSHCPVSDRRGRTKLMMKDQPRLRPSSRVCSCHLPPAFSSVSCFACGSSRLPSWGFPCLSCHSDRSIFAGDLMKAKLDAVLYVAHVMHGCTSAHPSLGGNGTCFCRGNPRSV